MGGTTTIEEKRGEKKDMQMEKTCRKKGKKKKGEKKDGRSVL